MRITPSGKGRTIVAQRYRAGIESEGISADAVPEAKPVDYDPIVALEQTLRTQESKPKQPSLANEPVKVEGTSKTLSDLYNDMLKSLGVTIKINQDNKFFDYEIDLSGNAASGFFVVPTYVTKDGDTQTISQDKANDIAKNMLRDYEVRKLVGKIKPASKDMGPHYRYEYSISPKKEGAKPASSFDEVLTVEKSASASKNQIIRDSHDHLLTMLLEKGFGGKNAS